MQRYCDGCRCHHDLSAFDLDRDEANALCRARQRMMARAQKAGARRKQQSKIEALENRRRSLIAALVKIDQEIALERAPAPVATAGALIDPDDVFGIAADLDPGD